MAKMGHGRSLNEPTVCSFLVSLVVVVVVGVVVAVAGGLEDPWGRWKAACAGRFEG